MSLSGDNNVHGEIQFVPSQLARPQFDDAGASLDSGGYSVLSDFSAGMLEKLGIFRVVDNDDK